MASMLCRLCAGVVADVDVGPQAFGCQEIWEGMHWSACAFCQVLPGVLMAVSGSQSRKSIASTQHPLMSVDLCGKGGSESSSSISDAEDGQVRLQGVQRRCLKCISAAWMSRRNVDYALDSTSNGCSGHCPCATRRALPAFSV